MMQDVIGSLLPYALTIAFGPVPIIVIAIMLQTPRPQQASIGFATGWITGMTVVVIALTIASSWIPQGDAEHPQRWVGLTQILLGGGMVILAAKKVLSRFGSTEEAVLPGSMSALSETTPIRALCVGVVASAINPKHVILVLPVGTIIANHGLSSWQLVISIAVFVILSSATVAGTAIAYAVSPENVGRVVDTGYQWMVRNMAVVSAAVLVLIGLNIIGKGIANF